MLIALWRANNGHPGTQRLKQAGSAKDEGCAADFQQRLFPSHAAAVSPRKDEPSARGILREGHSAAWELPIAGRERPEASL